ncbi:uncharacterized protein LOC135848773 [Planococcus citri]|uniref:uncharacterized protein LOC135848773 n=1 Tax=Planococcus citri TaxID=170843 RepID=UPI0031F80159
MNSLHVGIFTVLTVFTSTVFSAVTHDQFVELFNKRASMQEVLAAVFDNDQATQFKDFQTIQEHVNARDDYTDYANKLKKAAQSVLDSKLRAIGHQSIDIEEYMTAANDVASGVPLENKELENVVKEMLERKNKMMTASEEEKKQHLAAMTQAAEAAFEEALSHESAQFQRSHAAGHA